MTEIDYLKAKLEDKEKAFDKLYERYIKLLKQQGELERENEQLNQEVREYIKALNKTLEEKEELWKENEQLKKFISKIDFAIIRKYDNSLENLLDEVYDGEYENWVKKQVSRAKKLDGDVE